MCRHAHTQKTRDTATAPLVTGKRRHMAPLEAAERNYYSVRRTLVATSTSAVKGDTQLSKGTHQLTQAFKAQILCIVTMSCTVLVPDRWTFK